MLLVGVAGVIARVRHCADETGRRAESLKCRHDQAVISHNRAHALDCFGQGYASHRGHPDEHRDEIGRSQRYSYLADHPRAEFFEVVESFGAGMSSKFSNVPKHEREGVFIGWSVHVRHEKVAAPCTNLGSATAADKRIGQMGTVDPEKSPDAVASVDAATAEPSQRPSR
jgi:hypothetical protein